MAQSDDDEQAEVLAAFEKWFLDEDATPWDKKLATLLHLPVAPYIATYGHKRQPPSVGQRRAHKRQKRPYELKEETTFIRPQPPLRPPLLPPEF